MKERMLNDMLINNLIMNDSVLFRNGKKYSIERRNKNITMKKIARIIGDKESKFILLYSVTKWFTTVLLVIKTPGLS